MINLNKFETVNVLKFSKFLLINLTCNLLVVVANGQKLKEFIVNKKEHLLGEFEDSSGKSNFIVYPTLAYTPETKTEIGLVNLYLFYAKKIIRIGLVRSIHSAFIQQKNNMEFC